MVGKESPFIHTHTRISQFQMYTILLLNLAKTPLKVKRDYVAQAPIDPLRKPPIKWPIIFFLVQKPCSLAPSRVCFVLLSFKTLTGQVARNASKTMKWAASLEKWNFTHLRTQERKGMQIKKTMMLFLDSKFPGEFLFFSFVALYIFQIFCSIAFVVKAGKCYF